MKLDMVRKAGAAQACVDRFGDALLDYKSADCVRLARLALVKQGVSVKPLKGLRWSSYRGALKALKESGFDTLADGMDATGCARIAPAMAVAGDVVCLPVSEDSPWGAALFVCVGNGKHLGFVNAGEAGIRCAVASVAKFETAWRVA